MGILNLTREDLMIAPLPELKAFIEHDEKSSKLTGKGSKSYSIDFINMAKEVYEERK